MYESTKCTLGYTCGIINLVRCSEEMGDKKCTNLNRLCGYRKDAQKKVDNEGTAGVIF